MISVGKRVLLLVHKNTRSHLCITTIDFLNELLYNKNSNTGRLRDEYAINNRRDESDKTNSQKRSAFMNAFGKTGLLCCPAAVLLAGCGDGDRDVSAVSAHKKKEEVQQIKYTKSNTLPETAERKEYDEKAA